MENKQLSLVTFEQAKRLKSAGFDWPTYGHHYVVEKIIPPSLDMADRALYNVPVGGLIGFDHGKNTVPAPTVALVLQYMRVEHALSGEIWSTASGWMWEICKANNGTNIIYLDAYDNMPGTNDGGAFDNFDDCASNVLDKLLTLIEK